MFLKRLKNGFIWLTKFFSAVATLWIAVVGILIVIDVLGRVFLNQPLTGTPELVKVSVVCIVFLQIPLATYSKNHMRSTMIHSRMGPVSQEIINIFATLICCTIMFTLFLSSWPDAVHSWKILEFEGEGALRVPVYPLRTIILIGSLMSGMHFVAQVAESILNIRKIRKG